MVCPDDPEIANNVTFCVHGCNISRKIMEFFEEISWVTWRAINTNEIPRQAQIWYANTHRLEVGIVRAGEQVYFEQFWNEKTNTTTSCLSHVLKNMYQTYTNSTVKYLRHCLTH